MKKLVAFVSLAFVSLVLCASPVNDFAFTIGQGMADWSMEGISFSYGFSMGLTKRLEADVTAVSTITPEPFGDNWIMAEVGYTLRGDRNTGTRVSAPGMNMVLSLGGFWNPKDGAVGPMVGFTPFTVGSSSVARRERFLRTELGWDVKNRRMFVAASLLDFDIYVKGTVWDWTR